MLHLPAKLTVYHSADWWTLNNPVPNGPCSYGFDQRLEIMIELFNDVTITAYGVYLVTPSYAVFASVGYFTNILRISRISSSGLTCLTYMCIKGQCVLIIPFMTLLFVF